MTVLVSFWFCVLRSFALQAHDCQECISEGVQLSEGHLDILVNNAGTLLLLNLTISMLQYLMRCINSKPCHMRHCHCRCWCIWTPSQTSHCSGWDWHMNVFVPSSSVVRTGRLPSLVHMHASLTIVLVISFCIWSIFFATAARLICCHTVRLLLYKGQTAHDFVINPVLTQRPHCLPTN